MWYIIGLLVLIALVYEILDAFDLDSTIALWICGGIAVVVIAIFIIFKFSPTTNNNDDDILTRNPANRCECGGYKNANDSYCDKCWLDKLGY